MSASWCAIAISQSHFSSASRSTMSLLRTRQRQRNRCLTCSSARFLHVPGHVISPIVLFDANASWASAWACRTADRQIAGKWVRLSGAAFGCSRTGTVHDECDNRDHATGPQCLGEEILQEEAQRLCARLLCVHFHLCTLNMRCTCHVRLVMPASVCRAKASYNSHNITEYVKDRS